MGKSTQKAEITNQIIATHIHSLIRKSGTGMLAMCALCTATLGGMLAVADHQLEIASGKFVINQNADGIIYSEPVLDDLHSFDDLVASVQSKVARELTSLLNFTSTTYKNLDKHLVGTKGTFRDDVMVNLSNYNITDSMLDGNSVYRLKFEIDGTPLMIDASANGVPLIELYNSTDIQPINEVQFDKMTIEVRAVAHLYKQGRLHRSYKIQFVVNIESVGRTDWDFVAMSGWES